MRTADLRESIERRSRTEPPGCAFVEAAILSGGDVRASDLDVRDACGRLVGDLEGAMVDCENGFVIALLVQWNDWLTTGWIALEPGEVALDVATRTLRVMDAVDRTTREVDVSALPHVGLDALSEHSS